MNKYLYVFTYPHHHHGIVEAEGLTDAVLKAYLQYEHDCLTGCTTKEKVVDFASSLDYDYFRSLRQGDHSSREGIAIFMYDEGLIPVEAQARLDLLLRSLHEQAVLKRQEKAKEAKRKQYMELKKEFEGDEA